MQKHFKKFYLQKNTTLNNNKHVQIRLKNMAKWSETCLKRYLNVLYETIIWYFKI